MVKEESAPLLPAVYFDELLSALMERLYDDLLSAGAALAEGMSLFADAVVLALDDVLQFLDQAVEIVMDLLRDLELYRMRHLRPPRALPCPDRTPDDIRPAYRSRAPPPH